MYCYVQCYLYLFLYIYMCNSCSCFFFFQAEDGIRDLVRSRGLGDVYKRQALHLVQFSFWDYETFNLRRGGTAFLGPNGAGKTLSLIHI